MPNNVRYNSMQQTQQQQQQSQTNLYNYQQQQQQQQQHRHHHHHHHHSHNTSPTPPVIPNASSYSNHRLTTSNNNNNNHQTHVASPLLSTNQSSAYFLDRIDLENYTTQTLKQTVETILSKTKSKGLKVKIALPDEGLIIHNITDPSQSWIFKTAELLYFWRDPYYLNIIVVITTNRSRRQSNRPYSAAVFRLRGTDSAQLFLQQARQFFSNLSASSNNSNVTKFNRNKSVESLNRIPNRTNDSNTLSIYKPKTKTLSSVNERTSSSAPKTISDNHHHRQHHHHHQSSQATPTTTTTNTTTTAIRRVTRAEFDPGKNPTTTSSTDNTSNRRTYSETASSTDSHTINSVKELTSYTKKSDDDDDDDKLTITSNNFSNEQVAELVRELKELRNEIASLKLSSNTTLPTQSESSKTTNDSSIRTSSPTPQDATSQSEVDAETQTDFSLTNRRRATSKKNKKTMIGTGGISSVTTRKKPSQSKTRNGRRTVSNSSTNTVSEQEETTSDISSQVNDSTNDTNIVRMPEQQQQQQQPNLLAAPPRPVILKIQNNSSPPTNSTSYPLISHTNPIEEGSLSSGLPATIEKETSKFLSTNNSSSNSDTIAHSSSKILPAGASNFRSPLENSNSPAEHIYENIPISIQPNSNRDAYYNIPIINADDPQQQQNQSDGHNYYPTNNRESESQQQYSLNGQTLSNSPLTTDNTNSSEGQVSLGNIQQQQKPQIVSAGRHRNQPIYFANHLTNPVFNVDKQLLINTVANQFGVDLNSPQLQQLITNQHLFVARKRTFANMVWQLTPDEETALCSPSTSTRTSIIDIDTIDSNNSTARSILKAKKRLNSTSKRRGIRWDSTLE